MRVIEDSVPVDALVAVVKDSIRLAGVSNVSGTRDLRVASVQLLLEVVANRTTGGGLSFRVPIIGTEVHAGGRVARQDTHSINMTLVPTDRPPARGVRGGDVQQALVEAIATIRETMASAAGGDDPWTLSAGTVELTFAVTKSGNISLGADRELTNEVRHRLRLGLEPFAPVQS